MSAVVNLPEPTPAVLAPLGAVLARAVPEHPADDGIIGPRSIVWRVHRDRAFPVAGIRSLLMQALHPLAMAGVAQHSDWEQDPAARLAATSGWVLTATYGERAVVERAGARIRAIHEHVRGVDAETGLAYSASDPALLLYVHVAMVESIVVAVRRFGRGLDDAEADRYVADTVPMATAVGIPAAMVPTTLAGISEAVAGVELLRVTAAARRAMDVVLDPPALGVDPDLAELWRDVGRVAVGTLPDAVREAYGYPAPPPELGEREPVRQLLGVLDVAFEGLPGVVEARRRIELRMRAAAR